MAPLSTFFLYSPASVPAGGGTGTGQAPASFIRTYYYQRQRRLVAAAVKRRYKGTARKEAILADLIEQKVAEAMETCAGTGQADEGCRVAWDEVEEVSRAKADLRRRIAEGAVDPLEPFCSDNPLSEDCAVVYDD